MNGEGEIMEMPAEVDFSDSHPNPYPTSGKCAARR